MQNLKANQGMDVIIGLSANKKVENRAKVPYAQIFFSFYICFRLRKISRACLSREMVKKKILCNETVRN